MKKSRSLKKSGADPKKPRTMKDEDIDLSDMPEATPEMFARGILRYGLKPVDKKELLILRLDRCCRVVPKTASIRGQNQRSVA